MRPTPDPLTVVGGATQSPIFMQLMADVLGCTLRVPASSHTCVLRGAAVVAVAGMAAVAETDKMSNNAIANTDVKAVAIEGKVQRSAVLAKEMRRVSRKWLVIEKMFHPDPSRHREYDFYYERYTGTYARLRDEMHVMVAHRSRL